MFRRVYGLFVSAFRKRFSLLLLYIVCLLYFVLLCDRHVIFSSAYIYLEELGIFQEALLGSV